VNRSTASDAGIIFVRKVGVKQGDGMAIGLAQRLYGETGVLVVKQPVASIDCKIARNFDPAPNSAQRIDFVTKDWN